MYVMSCHGKVDCGITRWKAQLAWWGIKGLVLKATFAGCRTVCVEGNHKMANSEEEAGGRQVAKWVGLGGLTPDPLVGSGWEQQRPVARCSRVLLKVKLQCVQLGPLGLPSTGGSLASSFPLLWCLKAPDIFYHATCGYDKFDHLEQKFSRERIVLSIP